MQKLILITVVFATLYSCCLCENEITIKPGLVNKKVERKVDLSSQLVQISTSVTVENTGSSAVNSYVFGLDPIMENSLAFAGASVSIILFHLYFKPNLKLLQQLLQVSVIPDRIGSPR